MRSQKTIIIGILVILVIGTMIAFYVSSNISASRKNRIDVMMSNFSATLTMKVLSPMGISNIDKEILIEKDETFLLVKSPSKTFSVGIEFDKDAETVKRIYGTIDATFEQLFKEAFKDRLAPDFIVE